MIKAKEQSFETLCALTGNVVKFVSSCEFFPNFNVAGRITNVYINKNNEITFTLNTVPNNRKLEIGVNMRDLRYEIIK